MRLGFIIILECFIIIDNFYYCYYFLGWYLVLIFLGRSWDHHDILSVLPEFISSGHCSSCARVRSIASYSGRKETAVYATDVHTGMVIRSKVYIDNFSRIQIFHNSIKLDLDGLATLHVRAFDDEGNDEMLKFIFLA